ASRRAEVARAFPATDHHLHSPVITPDQKVMTAFSPDAALDPRFTEARPRWSVTGSRMNSTSSEWSKRLSVAAVEASASSSPRTAGAGVAAGGVTSTGCVTEGAL